MTRQTSPGALAAFASVIGSVAGVKVSEHFHLFNINERVFAVNYVATTVTNLSELGTVQKLVTLFSDIITPFVNGTDEMETILTIADLAEVACISEMSSAGTGTMFGGAIDTFENCRTEILPNYPYGNVPHIGYRVILEDVKLKYDL